MAGGATGSRESIRRLVIPEVQWQVILDHVQQCFPEEACGLAGGIIIERSVQVAEILLVSNVLHSPVRFRMDPEEQLRAFSTLEEHGLDLVAIFHSHPTGPETPSSTDVAEFFYPGVLSLIISRSATSGQWGARSFIIAAGESFEIPLVIQMGK